MPVDQETRNNQKQQKHFFLWSSTMNMFANYII